MSGAHLLPAPDTPMTSFSKLTILVLVFDVMIDASLDTSGEYTT